MLNLDPKEEEETLIKTEPTDEVSWWFWLCCNDCAKCFICFNWCRGRKTVITT